MTQYVYFFGGGKADGHKGMKDTLGGKGAGLAEMTNASLPVPPGFTISTAACNLFQEKQGSLPKEIDGEIDRALDRLEKLMGKRLGDAADPLLVSVRSGAKFSMPGMMDTILNLGLNDRSVEGLKGKTRNGRFAADSYRRFIQMFGNVVLGIEKDRFEHELNAVKKKQKVKADVDLTEDALREVIARFKKVVKAETGEEFPQEPRAQLYGARDAVFKSWMNARAVTYRKLNDIPHDLGTAVNVQSMVFGNMGDSSATGVGFTRNPSTGAREFYGEFLQNAQGEDVVAGIRTPQPIAQLEQVDAGGLQAAAGDHEPAGAALQGRAGLRVHHPGEHAVHAPDPQRQADRAGGSAHRGRHGGGRHHHEAGSGRARGAAVARPAPAPRVRPQGTRQGGGRGQGPARVARRGHGRDRLHRGRRGGLEPEGQARPARAHGDGSGRHPRHERGPGHPDRDRRHDVARGGGRPADGQAVGRRLRGAGHRRQGRSG